LRYSPDRVEIEALRGEFTDAAMMRDYDRLASLFTPDGALRMPNIPVSLTGRLEVRRARLRGQVPRRQSAGRDAVGQRCSC
jgi:ketosteroid isomerase-like protein